MQLLTKLTPVFTVFTNVKDSQHKVLSSELFVTHWGHLTYCYDVVYCREGAALG